MSPSTTYALTVVVGNLLFIGLFVLILKYKSYKTPKDYQNTLIAVWVACIGCVLGSICLTISNWQNIKAMDAVSKAPSAEDDHAKKMAEYQQKAAELKQKVAEMSEKVEALKKRRDEVKARLKQIGVDFPEKQLLERGNYELKMDADSDSKDVSDVTIQELFNKGVKATASPDKKTIIFSELTEQDAKRIQGLLEKAGAKVELSEHAP